LIAVVSLTIGGAYLAGGLARSAIVHAKIERLAGAASHGFSETALEAATDHDAAALAIARRFDPTSVTLETQRDERLAAFADGLQARRGGPALSLARADAGSPVSGLLVKASLTTESPVRSVPVARPFNLRGALDESRDLECLTQAVYYEARGESASGQAAVAQVVLNRTRHPAFPKTVCGVVFQGVRGGGCQFSFACDGSVGRRVENHAWRRAEKVAARALDGFVMDQVGTATHFHVARLSPGWGARLSRVAQVGAHVFYRFGGRGGSTGAFSATPLPSEPLTEAPAQAQPVYASLSLAPLANSVANTVANSVAGAAAAGAELVMSAAAHKPGAAAKSEPVKAATTPASVPAPTAPPQAPAAAIAPTAEAANTAPAA
jgi:hypothetical protein